MLHIGAGQVISLNDVVLIRPLKGLKPAEAGSEILLKSGEWIPSILSAKTLEERIAEGEIALRMKKNAAGE